MRKLLLFLAFLAIVGAAVILAILSASVHPEHANNLTKARNVKLPNVVILATGGTIAGTGPPPLLLLATMWLQLAFER
jgi:L-asparaginase/Glu-tRNA(Gln) amidotransferase subunit D